MIHILRTMNKCNGAFTCILWATYSTSKICSNLPKSKMGQLGYKIFCTLSVLLKKGDIPTSLTYLRFFTSLKYFCETVMTKLLSILAKFQLNYYCSLLFSMLFHITKFLDLQRQPPEVFSKERCS